MKRFVLLVLLLFASGCSDRRPQETVYLPQFSMPYGFGDLLAFSLPGLEPLGEVRVCTMPMRAARRPGGDELWIFCEGSRDLMVYDTRLDSLTRRIPVDAAASGGAFTPDGRLLVLPHGAQIAKSKGASRASVMDADSGALLAGFEVGADAYSAAVTPDGRWAFVASGAEDRITPIDLAALRAIDGVMTGPGPFSMTADPKDGRLYVACRGPRTGGPGRFVAHALPGLETVASLESERHPVQVLRGATGLVLLEAGDGKEGLLRLLDDFPGPERARLELDGKPGLAKITGDGRWLALTLEGAELAMIDLEDLTIAARRRLPDPGGNRFAIQVE